MKNLCKVLLLSLLIFTVITGCTNNVKPNKNQTSEPSTTTAPTTEKEPVVDDHTINIKTSGGAVIIGEISKDDNGFYIVPERDLKVELTNDENTLKQFDNVTRINMYDSSVDEIDKNDFKGKVVTVSGKLQSDKTEKTLSLFAYLIEDGRYASASRAEETLDKTGHTAPVPDIMKSTVKDGQYVYNPYMLTPDTLKFFGNDFCDFYIDMVNAYLNYETSCPCPNTSYLDNASSIITNEFPMFTADAKLDYDVIYDPKAKKIAWSYSVDKDEHNRLIEEFKNEANKFLKNAKPEQSEKLRAQNVYHSIGTTVKYDYETCENTMQNIEPYNAYIRHSGICETFSYAYAQLMTQVGVKCDVAMGFSSASKTSTHAWNCINIDGKNYFCDVTYELNYMNGEGFKEFGMTLQDRLDDGVLEEEMRIGDLCGKPISQCTISDERLIIESID